MQQKPQGEPRDIFDELGIDPSAPAQEPAASSSAPRDIFDELGIDIAPTVGEQAGGQALGALKGSMRSVKWVPDLVEAVVPNPVTRAASDFFQEGIDAADQLTPEAYRIQQQQPIAYRDESGELRWQLPSIGQAAGVVIESLPQIPSMLAAGGGSARVLQGLGMAKGAAQAIGYGAANSATVTPLQRDEVLREARIEGQQQGLAGDALEQYATERADALAQMVAPLTFATGAAGLGLAARMGEGSGNVLAGFAKGVAGDTPFEAIEEAGQNVAADIAMRRQIDTDGAMNAGALGAIAGGVTGGALGAVSSRSGVGAPEVDTRQPSRNTQGGRELAALMEEELAATESGGNAEAVARQQLDPGRSGLQQGRQEVPPVDLLVSERPGQANPAPPDLAAADATETVSDPAAEPSDVALGDNGTGVFRVPVEQIRVDPKTYQFRSRVGEQGTDSRLQAVEQWDDKRAGSVVLHRRTDGQLYVADGHHRVELARRLGQPAINAVILDEASGIDVPKARREAAMINIAGGNADVLDVAKVFRESGGVQPSKVRAANNLPSNQLTADAEALAALGGNVFGMVAAGQLDEKAGAAIGRGFADPAQQQAAAGVFQKIQPATAYQRELLMQEIRAADFAAKQGEQSSLFGDDEQQVSLLQHRLAVLDRLRQALNADKRLFTSLNEHAGRAEQAGNTIATEANAQISEVSRRSLDMLGRVTTTPALNEMVNAAARRIAGGEPAAGVVRELKKGMINYGQQDAATGTRGAHGAGSQPAAQGGQNAGSGQRLPAHDTDGSGDPRESGSAGEGAGSAIVASEDFQLTQHTEDQLAEQARQRKEQEKAAADAQRKAGEQQSEAANAEFQLGQDAERNLSGQRGMFDEQEQQERGAFGPIFREFRHDAAGAIARLKEVQDGEAVAALYHPEVGDIDLVWGKEGTGKSDGLGLAKLVKFHPEVLGDLQGFISGLLKNEARSGKNRIRLESPTGFASVRLDWDGEAKNWLMTAFEKKAATGTRTDTTDSRSADDTARRRNGPEETVAQAAAEQSNGVIEDTGDSLYSRAGLSPSSVVVGKPLANPISLADSEAAAQAFLADYNGNIELSYLIRKTQRELYGSQGDVDRIGIVKGAYHPERGVFTLASDHLSSLGDARSALRHEILGHYGLDTFHPADKQALLEKVLSSRDEPSLVQAWGKVSRLYADMPETVQAEEVFAYLAEQERSAALKAMDFLRAALTRLLRHVGYKRHVITRSELLREVEVISRGIRSGRRSRKTMDSGGPRFSLLPQDDSAGTPPVQGRMDVDTQQDGQGVKLPGETAARKAQRLVQDKLNRFTVLKEWLAERGVTLSEDADVYRAEERMHSRFANKAKDFREGTVQPLVEKIQKAGFSMTDIAQYLHAQHAMERNAQVARHNKQMPDGGSGMSNADARAILAAADPKLVTLANEFRAITDRTRQVLLGSGLISKEMTRAWQQAYQHYVPLKGGPDGQAVQSGTGKGLSARFRPKRALGHKIRPEGEWIIENIIADHERALMAAEKNLVARHLLKMAMDVGIDSIMTVSKPEKRAVLRSQTAYEVLYKGLPVGTFETLEGARTFKATAPKVMSKSTGADFSIRKSSDPSVVYMASPMPAPNEALVYVDGEAIRIQINDDLLARAYNNLGMEALNTFMAVGRYLNRWFSTVYTGYSPEFLPKNIFRDFTTGLANITGEEGALFAAKAAKNYFASFGALLRYAFKGTADSWIRQYREDGGNTGAAYLSDLERLGADVQAEYAAYQGVLANLRKGSLRGAARAAGRRAFNATLRHIEALNEAGENAMRLALYRTAIEQGMTRNHAASLAKNTTVNFNRKGELGAQANALYLFFNAGVQGTASIAHAHFKGKHKEQAWALSGAMAALAYGMALLAAGADEDEYEKTPDHVKARNLVIPLGDGKSHTIPVPYGYGFFFTFGRLAADAQRTGSTDGVAWKLAASFAGEFTPFGGVVAGDEPEMKQASIFMMPTMAQIPLSVANNRSSFGGPIYPENSFKQFEPDRQKMWRGTAGTLADRLAGALEGVGVDVSPETLKHMNRTFTGGAGNFVASAWDAVSLAGEGATPEAREIPFLRSFYRENGVGDARARFWRYQAKVQKAAEELERAKAAGDRSRVQALVGENRELIAMAETAKDFSQASRAVQDLVQEIRLSDLPIAEQRDRIRRIEQRETELYDRFVGIFKARVGRGE